MSVSTTKLLTEVLNDYPEILIERLTNKVAISDHSGCYAEGDDLESAIRRMWLQCFGGKE